MCSVLTVQYKGGALLWNPYNSIASWVNDSHYIIPFSDNYFLTIKPAITNISIIMIVVMQMMMLILNAFQNVTDPYCKILERTFSICVCIKHAARLEIVNA